MPACTRSAIAMFTDFFAADDIDATARRTGFVKRTSKLTGTLFLTLVTFGMWSATKTTGAQWAAKVPPVGAHVVVSPEAMYPRLNTQALAFLQEMSRQPLAKVQSLAMVCADQLCTAFAKVALADRTGFG